MNKQVCVLAVVCGLSYLTSSAMEVAEVVVDKLNQTQMLLKRADNVVSKDEAAPLALKLVKKLGEKKQLMVTLMSMTQALSRMNTCLSENIESLEGENASQSEASEKNLAELKKIKRLLNALPKAPVNIEKDEKGDLSFSVCIGTAGGAKKLQEQIEATEKQLTLMTKPKYLKQRELQLSTLAEKTKQYVDTLETQKNAMKSKQKEITHQLETAHKTFKKVVEDIKSFNEALLKLGDLEVVASTILNEIRKEQQVKNTAPQGNGDNTGSGFGCYCALF